MRGAALLEFLHEALPEWIALPAAVVTQAGDTWTIVLVGVVASVVVCRDDDEDPGDSDSDLNLDPECESSLCRRIRRSRGSRDTRGHQGPWPLALVVGGLALMGCLKYAFALPRPETTLLPVESVPAVFRPWYVDAGSPGGYAFPSGHAVGATVAYGLLASVLDAGTRRQRIAAAGAIVAAVSGSRVVLGVHYPADVVAGIVLGLGYLAGSWWLLERCADRTTAALTIASGFALAAVLVSGGAGLAVSLFGLCLGALGCWLALHTSDGSASTAADSTRLHAEQGLVLAVVAVAAGGSVVFGSALVVQLFGLGAAMVLLTTRL